MPNHPKISRREFLSQTGQTTAGMMLASALPAFAREAGKPRLKIATIGTVFAFRTHVHVHLENMVEPYLFNGEWVSSGMEMAGLYLDQFPSHMPGRPDLKLAFTEKYKIPVYQTIAETLCLGGEKLAVDGVLLIGEHGDYPTNAKGQVEYPRKRFFDEIIAVFRRSGRVVPVFNDKHLSYRWDWAKEMYDTARAMNIPFMAGSSLPLTQRRPPLELPPQAKVEEAVSVHGGPVESYDFHAFEALESIIEARQGSETGIVCVQFLTGDALWKAAEEGRWSPDLAQAAVDAEPDARRPSAKDLIRSPQKGESGPPYVKHGILLKYRDGLRGVVLAAATDAIYPKRWHFACKLAGETGPRATSLYVGPWNNRNAFKALSHATQMFFRERRSPYSVERTLLASGVLDAAMESRFRGGELINTPHLAIAYEPRDFRALREMGASWNIITEDIPEPKGIDLWRKP
ncbi:MAG: hypothetical protein EXS39_00790 [Opitutaceae bacterium]|nr:hypothetical protein [Opitutaceae bacterium]